MFARFASRGTKLPAVIDILRYASEYTGPNEKCLNMVQILGRVGQDPVTRGGKGNFVTFNVATTKSYPKVQADGKTEYISKTEWHNICVFRPFLIERVQRSVNKGTRVMVIGSIEYVDYEKADGGKFDKTRVVPDDIFVLSATDDTKASRVFVEGNYRRQ